MKEADLVAFAIVPAGRFEGGNIKNATSRRHEIILKSSFTVHILASFLCGLKFSTDLRLLEISIT